MVIFHSYVSLPEGKYEYIRVNTMVSCNSSLQPRNIFFFFAWNDHILRYERERHSRWTTEVTGFAGEDMAIRHHSWMGIIMEYMDYIVWILWIIRMTWNVWNTWIMYNLYILYDHQ